MSKSFDEIWIQSLALLFQACEPLTYDCLRSEEEHQELINNIEKHSCYCSDVKYNIERGKVPPTWDEWNNSHSVENLEVENLEKIEPINIQEFSDILTSLFATERKL